MTISISSLSSIPSASPVPSGVKSTNNADVKSLNQLDAGTDTAQAGTTQGSTDAAAVAARDGNQVGQQESADGATKLTAALNSQFDQSRVSAATGSDSAASGAASSSAGSSSGSTAVDSTTSGVVKNLSVSQSGSSSKTYEAADKNEDGTVTEQERADYKQTSAYINAHPNLSPKEGTGNTREMQASAAYAQGAASFQTAQTSSIEATI